MIGTQLKLIFEQLQKLNEKIDMLLEGFSVPREGRPPQTDNIKETTWRPTKNPEIEWCPEKDANRSDLEQAIAKIDGMWTTFSEEYGYSLFRKKR